MALNFNWNPSLGSTSSPIDPKIKVAEGGEEPLVLLCGCSRENSVRSGCLIGRKLLKMFAEFDCKQFPQRNCPWEATPTLPLMILMVSSHRWQFHIIKHTHSLVSTHWAILSECHSHYKAGRVSGPLRIPPGSWPSEWRPLTMGRAVPRRTQRGLATCARHSLVLPGEQALGRI